MVTLIEFQMEIHSANKGTFHRKYGGKIVPNLDLKVLAHHILLESLKYT
jgi:hypothetical protein